MGKQLKAIRNPNTVKFTPTPPVGAAPPMVAAPSSPAVRATFPGATPSTPATPGAQAQPFDAIHDTTIAGNIRTAQNQNVGYDAEESATKRAYGLDDPSDPFSRAQMLREAYQNRARGSGNSLAAQGQLYSGAYQNAQNAATHSFDVGYDQLRKEQDAVLAGIASKRAASWSALGENNLNADAEALGRATQNEPDPATLPPPVKKKIKVKAKGTKYTGMR